MLRYDLSHISILSVHMLPKNAPSGLFMALVVSSHTPCGSVGCTSLSGMSLVLGYSFIRSKGTDAASAVLHFVIFDESQVSPSHSSAWDQCLCLDWQSNLAQTHG